TARTRYSPVVALAAGFTSNLTVCDSSGRANVTGCSAGVAVHPAGSSSVTTPSAAAGDPFTTVTRISRDDAKAAGGATAGAGLAGGAPLRPDDDARGGAAG